VAFSVIIPLLVSHGPGQKFYFGVVLEDEHTIANVSIRQEYFFHQKSEDIGSNPII